MSNWLSRVQEIANCLKDCAKGKVPPKHVLKRYADRLEKYVNYKMNTGEPTMNKRERIEQAVIELGAIWPDFQLAIHDESLDLICTRAEFEHVVGDFKRLHKWSGGGRSCFMGFDEWIKDSEWLKDADLIYPDWRTPLPTEQPKNWHEAGELPPVGEVVEGYIHHGHWRWTRVEILKVTDNECAVHALDLGLVKWCDQFRPIKSERERVIEAAFQIIYDADDYRTGAEKLYDAGMLKLPELNQ